MEKRKYEEPVVEVIMMEGCEVVTSSLCPTDGGHGCLGDS